MRHCQFREKRKIDVKPRIGRNTFIWIFWPFLIALIPVAFYAAPRLFAMTSGEALAPIRFHDGLTPLVAAQIPAVARALFSPMGLQSGNNAEAHLAIMTIWATWCPPCRAEMPEIVKFRNRHHSADQAGDSLRNVPVILVSADDLNMRDDVLKFLKSVSIDFDSYIVGEDAPIFVRALSPTWSGGLPATFILDANGKVLEQFVGTTTEASLEARTLDLQIRIENLNRGVHSVTH